ncbi:VOC family protein [Actinoalloteichus spitiensis]|uniref:VOC family protein n=1 Tax=Actinoalloteichus spitiensis TaxID=252394 RepID=UPI0003110C7B|nr:VOC family protein [Actinoalloteichus spitiensis]
MSETTAPDRPATPLALEGYVLDCPDPRALASFYQDLLGWTEVVSDTPDWVSLRNPSGGTLSFQRDPEVPPSTWPSRERHQMAHLDVTVPDLAAECERAVRIGATRLSGEHENWVVFADPAGHPFCLCRG